MAAVSVYQCIVTVKALSHLPIPKLASSFHDLQIYTVLCLKLIDNTVLRLKLIDNMPPIKVAGMFNDLLIKFVNKEMLDVPVQS